MPADELLGGIAALVDHLRRRRLLYDSRRAIFSRFWHEGDREIQRGYLPVLPGPQGMKLRAAADDDKARVFQWIGARGTLLQQIAMKWGVASDDVPEFLEGLWQYLNLTHREIALLTPVTLKGSKDRALPNCSGVYHDGETRLKHLLSAAGFTTGDFQKQIRFKQPLVLDPLIGGTTPDVYFVGDADDPDDKGLCIYLDGLSGSLHGDPTIAARDQEIRSWLRNNGYQVIEITRVDLDDRPLPSQVEQHSPALSSPLAPMRKPPAALDGSVLKLCCSAERVAQPPSAVPVYAAYEGK